MAEVKARLSLDSTGFVSGLGSAEAKFAKFGGQLAGASRQFGAFNSLMAGVGLSMEQTGGGFKSIMTSMAGAGVVVGAVMAIAAAWQAVKDSVADVQKNYEDMGYKQEGFIKTLARNQLWYLGIDSNPDVDQTKKNEMNADYRRTRIGNMLKAMSGGSLEDRIAREAGKRGITGGADLRNLVQSMSAADAARQASRSQRADSYLKVGLGTAYGPTINYQQQIADNTKRMVTALERDYPIGGVTAGQMAVAY